MKSINKEFNPKNYTHIGYSYPGVPAGWSSTLYKTIPKIEKAMWPSWMPMWIKRLIHRLATGNSCVRVRSRFWDKIRKYFTKGQMITDIKEKFATLRIYGYFGDEIAKIIEQAELECSITCAKCGYTEEWIEDPVYMKTVNLRGWYTNLCTDCRKELKEEIVNEPTT